jgi:LPS-assembly protein
MQGNRLLTGLKIARAVLVLGLMGAAFYSPRGTQAALVETHDEQPVLLSAAELGYDRKNALVIARGGVEVVQGEQIVLADRIIYSQNENEVYASGNVSMRRPNGDVMFADNVRLKDNLEAGVINNFRARLADNSLFAAREARRLSPEVTELDYAIYTPCKVCKGGDPLWQLKAKKVHLDEGEDRVTYEDAQLEVWGVPVAYTPWFRHATPDAESKSGLLTPDIQATRELGTMVRQPVYLAIAPNVDMTLAPMVTTKEAPILFGQYRHMFENGYMEWEGSITNPDKRDSSGQRTEGNEIRGHIDAFGQFNLHENWNAGFRLNRSTDDTYLRRYNIDNNDLLTSRLFVEGIEGRRWASLQALAFQRMTAEIDDELAPYIVPMADFWWQSDPQWMGSRMELAANSMVLVRESGTESRRLSMRGGWKLPMMLPGGHLLEAETSLRGDIYSVEDVPLQNGTLYEGEQSRILPELSLRWRYPLINHYAPGKSLLIEPILHYAVSPHGQNDEEIPNEDGQLLEFNDANLFSVNRYPGYDRVETGSRLQFGARGQWQFAPAKRLEFLLGQNIQFNKDPTFPDNNNREETFSDYVGRLGLNWEDLLELAYRFRFDQDDLEMRRSEINTRINWQPVTLQVDYLNLRNDPFLDDREEIVANGALRLTDYWSWVAAAQRDLKDNTMIRASTGLRYQDECFSLLANLGRSFIRDRDVEGGTSFILRVGLQNLE